MTNVPSSASPNVSVVEQRLASAFADVRDTVDAAPDLFARVSLSLDAARARRRFRLRLAAGVAGFVFALVVFALAFTEDRNGRLVMPWWVIEVITNIVLVALAVGLGPFIKRFGRSYAADVFRANPRTGKSYLVLTDVAYYLIFTAFILFTVTFVEPADWDVVGEQLQYEAARVGGILLIMGVLHALNVVALPVIGRLLSSNKRFDESASGRKLGAAGAPLGAGTWLLRVEPAPQPAPPSDHDA